MYPFQNLYGDWATNSLGRSDSLLFLDPFDDLLEPGGKLFCKFVVSTRSHMGAANS